MTTRSMPEGIKARVLMSLDINAADNKTFRQIKNNQAGRGLMVKNHAPPKTKIPLARPMIRETLLPFLNPMNPPMMRNNP